MSRLLLDTHIWLWYLRGSNRLPPAFRRAIDRGPDAPWLSPASIWEIALLVGSGRLGIETPLREWIDNMTAALPMREAPITNEVALVGEEVALAHRDPADRFIVATAIVYDLTLMTLDGRLTKVPGVKTFKTRAG